MKKKGKIRYVANTGVKGIQFDDEKVWYNPTGSARAIIDKGFVGKTVEIDLVEGKNEFDEIIVFPEKEDVVIDAKDEAKDSELKEKVSQTLPKGIKNDDIVPSLDLDFPKESLPFLGFDFPGVTEYDVQVLQSKQLEIDKKGNLNYASWSEVWSEMKKLFPNANFQVYENREGMPYFSDHVGCFVKVGVLVKGLKHICHLPILDFKNKTIKRDLLNVFDINKAILRALVKACAMHGLGLYVYKGEDLPEETK